ncbi:MAG TPA: hypothetical protein DDY43_02570 [Synechococcales bacterium UBA10510]|nr:hypothetical protein [Synechococcales bacterium UBA10510]
MPEPSPQPLPAPSPSSQLSPANPLNSGASTPTPLASPDQPPRKGPLSFLSGALTSGLLGWLCLGLSAKVVNHYSLHPPVYSSAIAQSIATAVKTLVVGMTFLATFSFGFIALGLSLVFLRSLLALVKPGTVKSETVNSGSLEPETVKTGTGEPETLEP